MPKLNDAELACVALSRDCRLTLVRFLSHTQRTAHGDDYIAVGLYTEPHGHGDDDGDADDDGRNGLESPYNCYRNKSKRIKSEARAHISAFTDHSKAVAERDRLLKV